MGGFGPAVNGKELGGPFREEKTKNWLGYVKAGLSRGSDWEACAKLSQNVVEGKGE